MVISSIWQFLTSTEHLIASKTSQLISMKERNVNMTSFLRWIDYIGSTIIRECFGFINEYCNSALELCNKWQHGYKGLLEISTNKKLLLPNYQVKKKASLLKPWKSSIVSDILGTSLHSWYLKSIKLSAILQRLRQTLHFLSVMRDFSLKPINKTHRIVTFT